MINSKQAARIRYKVRTQRPASAKELADLADYDRDVRRGRSRKTDAAESAIDPPVERPSADLSTGPAPLPPSESPPASPEPPLPLPEPPPPVEAPPPVTMGTIVTGDGGAKGDWRAKYKTAAHASDDGRQMLCELVGAHWVGMLDAMAQDLRKAGIDPIVDPKGMLPLCILATDEILPERARLTPKLAAALGTTAIVGQRYWHHKKIVEVQKTDPEHAKWRAEQARKEAAERAQKQAHDEQVKSEQPEYAEPPPANESEEPSLNGKRTYEPTKYVVIDRDEPLV